MRRVLHQLTFAFALTLLFSIAETAAQQPAAGRQKAPRLTTDDVRRATEQPVVESKDAVKAQGAAKTEESAKADATDQKADQSKPSNTKLSPEESAWRERVATAREKARRLEKTSEEA